ncbi:YjgP/YjgQ family permease [Subsaximicrobium wynnwilliamsii]|uniref:YjgP/YjgQ family permease n=1 Tax=Subsaximicrobium wynnwilliamsii TaxID=291179 RepID=A0A5C6ZHH3_9FLAO|nr:LptF/LptG family permease [Subsaximicrobium wynnwilliamsii]TXD83091.1 YjgP/YjgQ family permease [Subsaximicrobium wynnwilliamsii]TXD88835.1 YjgP/YjgQ family permease [Subsaximicrobium wynnwilliamsii]TXE02908.1 YjgP/YjgQ family permease [Subsaximicrobium wynnwilliamsii]
MKILDRYILTTYLKTFLSVFLILMFIFVLQAIWLYIGDLAGKDLDSYVIVKLLLYITPTLIPLILPLTILLVSIMVFGSFAENYEFAAMKSTGISLQRAMRGLSFFIVLLGIVTFVFSNNVIPWANYNVYNLRKNIAQVKPALAISEGQFNEIGTYNIKVDKKTGENDEFLETVVIHEKSGRSTANRKIIIAKRGELKSNENSPILQLVLYEGNRYEEIFSNQNPKQNKKRPHAKSYFDEYTINVDIEGLNDVDIDDKSYDNRYNMLDVSALNFTIDSLQEKKVETLKNFSNTLYRRTAITSLPLNIKPKKDSLYTGAILDLFNDKTKIQLLNLASNSISSTKQIVSSNKQSITGNTKWMNKHIVALHEKYVLGIACIILFFVGAPLGALIRKGGIGLPLVIAILLFLSYHFIGIFAKNSSLDGTFSSVIATWLSTAIMLPLSIFLTTRATKDRGLLEFDHIIEPIKKLLKIKPKAEKEASNARKSTLDDTIIENLNLIGHEDRVKIKDSAAFETKLVDYKFNAKCTMVFYCIAIPLLVFHFIFKNNKLPAMASASLELFTIAGVILLIYFMLATRNLHQMYHYLEAKKLSKNPIWWVLGFVFYPLAFYIRRNKVSDDFSLDK